MANRRIIEEANAIFLYHMRKAGGTSLRQYCKKLSRAKCLPYDVVEGYSLNYENYFQFDRKTIHIISLREPLARIKSSYRFEGRWPQMEKHRTKKNAKPFAVWVREKIRDCGRPPDFLWTCLSNYYVKALIGYPRNGKESIGRDEFELATRRLESFEVVLITEWMNRPEVSRFLQWELEWDRELSYVTFPIASAPIESDAELFDEFTLRTLEEANYWDNKLYDFAKELSQSRIKTHLQAQSF